MGLIAFDCLYLKTDAQTQARFADAGCEPFVYEGKAQGQTGDHELLDRSTRSDGIARR